MNSKKAPIGVIGLGIMGGAYARHLRAAGFDVIGHDTDAAALERLEALGGSPARNPAEVASRAEVILLALPSVAALEEVISGESALAGVVGPGHVICEMGTFPLAEKERAAEAVAASGAILLDCPVSGTGAQAAEGDLVIYASGDEAALARARPALEALSREILHVGPFGAGTKMKIVANLLVSIHNLAAAEALLLAERLGLDLQLTYDAITAGAGTSRMLEVRGPLMIEGRYKPATMKQAVHAKDLTVIMDAARQSHTPTPLMAAALPLYSAALAQGRQDEDTASLFAVLQTLSTPPA